MPLDIIKLRGIYHTGIELITERPSPLIKMQPPKDQNSNSKRRFGPVSYYSQNFSTAFF